MSELEDALREVTLMPDVGHPWPLWESGTATPDDYDLSPVLRAALRSWYDDWQAHFDYKRGWDDVGKGRTWSERGYEIASRLESELDGRASVKYTGEPW